MRVCAVALSSVKGVPKDPVANVRLVREMGVEGDAHSGPGPRQVSILGLSSIRAMEQKFGTTLGYGRFGENIVVDGDLKGVEVGDLLGISDAVLEVTAIGKECHKGCAIRVKTGDCIMPREGVFCRVILGGVVKPLDLVKVVRPKRDLAVVVLAGGRSTRFGSDKRSFRLGGETLLDRALRTAFAVSSEVLVSVGHKEGSWAISGAKVVPDEAPDMGPLCGIVSALRASTSPLVAVLAVDQPGVTPDLIRCLAMRNVGVGTCLKWRGLVHALPCVLARGEALKVLEESLKRGNLALWQAFEEAGVTALEGMGFLDLGDPDSLLVNLNRPEDVAPSMVGGDVI